MNSLRDTYNAPIQIGDMYYCYDAAGNPTSILDTNGIGKDLEWNADNQLRSIVDAKEGLFHSYAYNHTGERILKRYGTAQNAYYNGKDMGISYAGTSTSSVTALLLFYLALYPIG